jgi:melanoma-associated antigen p97
VPGGWCTAADPYFGFDGAFRCLMETGDVAFLKHTTVKEMIESKSFKDVSEDSLELLCKNGERMPVSEYLRCNWGMVPSNALVTSSARTINDRKQYQRFFQSAVKHYSNKRSYNTTSSNNNNFNNNNDRFNRFDDQRNRFNDNREPFGRSTTDNPAQNDSILYENFDMFESARYGKRLNLMFQVSG